MEEAKKSKLIHIIAAIIGISTITLGFWFGEYCCHDVIHNLKESLLLRMSVLLPWLVALVVTEVRTGRLPNRLTLGCLLTGLGVSCVLEGVSIWSSIIGSLVGGVLLMPFFLNRSCGAGGMKMFTAVMSFWGIHLLPFVFMSSLCMSFVMFCARRQLSDLFKNSGRGIPTSPVVLLSVISVFVAIVFWNGSMIGGYVVIATMLVLSEGEWLLHSGKSSSAKSDDLVNFYTIDGDESTKDVNDEPAMPMIIAPTTVRGFRCKMSISTSIHSNLLYYAECIEDGCLGLKMGTPVVLKFMEETDSLSPFSDLQEAIARLQNAKSRHIVRYYGCFHETLEIAGKKKRCRVVAMEALDGADLNYRVHVRSPMFYADEIIYVLDQLLEGLCELSDAGIVHRDIKPSNIFICRDGMVKLIDFGLSKIGEIDLCPKNRRVVGTPEFSAPDFLTDGFRGDDVSDIFSVGMVLYFMMHGISPHRLMDNLPNKRMDDASYDAIWNAIASNSKMDGWWIWNDRFYDGWHGGGTRAYIPLLGIQKVLQRTLAFDRRNRFVTFAEFRKALRDVEFAQAKYGDDYARVISDSMHVSEAGSGWNKIYGRGKGTAVMSWGHTLSETLVSDEVDEHEQTLQILIHRMYDPTVPSACYPVVDLSKDAGKRGAFAEKIRSRVENLIKKEPFNPNNVANLRTVFGGIKSLPEWGEELRQHNLNMDLS